ncbi:MAG: TolC family protein [Pseudomonadota bacterium]
MRFLSDQLLDPRKALLASVVIVCAALSGLSDLRARASDQPDPFDSLRMISVFFTGKTFAITETAPRTAPALKNAEEPVPSSNSAPAPSEARQIGWEGIRLSSIWRPAAAPPAPRAFAATRLQEGATSASADSGARAASPEQPVDVDIVSASSIYEQIAAAPEVRRQATIDDGDERQYRRTLDRTPIETTKPDLHVNDLLQNPPDTAEVPLTLRDVIIYTLKNNPDIGIALWQAEDARYAVRGAKSPFLPTVELTGGSGIENTFIENAEDGGVYGLNRREGAIRFSQRIYDFGRSAQLLKRARALFQSRELAFDDTVEDTVLAAVTAYLDLLGASELLDNAQANVREHQAIYDLVKINYDGGNTSEAELRRVGTRLDRARTAMLDAENRRENAINNFRNVTGLAPGRLTEPKVDVAAADYLNDLTIDDILARNFRIQAFVRDGNSLRHQIKATNRSYLPEVNLDVVGRYQDNVLGNTAGTTEGRAILTARWNLYDGGLAASRANQLRSRERENEQRIVKLRNELREEASNIIAVLRTTADKRAIFDEQVDSSRRVVDLYSKQFEAGRRTLLELLDAQADFAEAREESIVNKYENLSASFSSLRLQNDLTPTLANQLGFDAPAQGR